MAANSHLFVSFVFNYADAAIPLDFGPVIR